VTPLERHLPLNEIGKIRVECGGCQTAVTFDLNGPYPPSNVGAACPFCRAPWGKVEMIVIGLARVLDDAYRNKAGGHLISVVEKKTAAY
jgi:hypothetical protein